MYLYNYFFNNFKLFINQVRRNVDWPAGSLTLVVIVDYIIKSRSSIFFQTLSSLIVSCTAFHRNKNKKNVEFEAR
jgi:hypothetical protein